MTIDLPCLGILIAVLGVIIANMRRLGRLEGKVELLCRLVRMANGVPDKDSGEE